MKIYYDKNRMNKYIGSSILLLLFLNIIGGFLIKDKSWAILIACGSAMIYLIIRTIVLIIYMLKNNQHLFIKINADELIINEINGEEKTIRLDSVEYIACNEEQMCILFRYPGNYQKRSWLQRLMIYYMEQNSNCYIYPLYCNSLELERLCNNNGIEFKKNMPMNSNEYTNLLSRYIVVLVGIVTFFVVSVVINYDIVSSSILFLVLGVLEVFIRIKDKVFLTENKASIGLVIRCIMFSAFISQYIFLACRIEEWIKQNYILGTCSIETGIIFIMLYLMIMLLFLPKKGLGKRIPQFFIEGGFRAQKKK